MTWQDTDKVSQLVTSRDLLLAGIGAILGAILEVLADRAWRRVESKPRFRIQVGGFQSIYLGSGISLTITNAGFNPLPEYDVVLFHPKRGSLEVFHSELGKSVFPQYPEQWNKFECPTGPLLKPPPGWQAPPQLKGMADFVKHWFLTVANSPVSAPSFTDFGFQLVLKNSELVLFEDEELGNSLAKQLFESVAGQRVEQEVKHVFYKSKAPFWVEWIRKIKIRRSLRDLKRGVR